MIKFYNTLTHKVDEFKPLKEGVVKLYTCGPTVYASAHIGNLRAYIFNDLLKRVLISNGYKVNHVMNITNVDDKTIHQGHGNLNDFNTLVKKFEDKFWADFGEINNLKPNIITRPTEYIDKIVSFIQKLIDKGVAYSGDDGSIYFSIAKFPTYGKLSGLDMTGLKSGARVCQDEYDKENPADFVLWKAWTPEDGEVFWQTSLGKGRPGWHIECSVMATDNLGETIDIHTGGVDLVFPHHENEIAQTEAVTGEIFSRNWLHNEHLLVDGKKMSKSLDNFYTLDDIKAKGFSGLDFRYLCLQAHYRTKLNFTWEGLEAAKNARLRLVRILEEQRSGQTGTLNMGYSDQFNLKLANDLDSPGALAVLWDLVRSDKVKPEDKQATIAKMDEVLGLNLVQNEVDVKLTPAQEKMVEARVEARQTGDFAKADELRNKLAEAGINIEDTKNGQKITRDMG
jgi:cysteinyl-tRNA synthetase